MEVSQDIPALTEYAYRMIEHAAASQGARTPVPPPAIPAPYTRWLGHLARLEQALDRMPALGQRLRADAVNGLDALHLARERFRRNYKQCPGCARFIFRAARRCPCGEKF